MLSAWPPVTASCATATSSASTDAESRRFVVIRLCYISPTFVGTRVPGPDTPGEPKALARGNIASSLTERIRSCMLQIGCEQPPPQGRRLRGDVPRNCVRRRNVVTMPLRVQRQTAQFLLPGSRPTLSCLPGGTRRVSCSREPASPGARRGTRAPAAPSRRARHQPHSALRATGKPPARRCPLTRRARSRIRGFTMRAQGPFRHSSRTGPKLASPADQPGEQLTWNQWSDSYLKESWSLMR